MASLVRMAAWLWLAHGIAPAWAADAVPVMAAGDALLAGISAPLLGAPHLIFMIGLGLAALRLPKPWYLPVAFVAASLVGLAFRVGGGDLPYAGTLAALSILGLGAVLLMNVGLPLSLWFAGALIAGIIHGYLYAGAILGAGPVPLVAFVVACVIAQMALIVAVSSIMERVGAGSESGKLAWRLTAVVVAAVGLVLSASAVMAILAGA